MSLYVAWEGIKSIVEDWKTLKPKKEESFDKEPKQPNKRTLKAFEDGVEGRMIKMESVDEFFKKVGL